MFNLQFAICDLKKNPHPGTLPAYRAREITESARGMRVSIAGAGMITPLGTSAEETWGKLLRGASISDHASVNKQWVGRSRVVGLALDAAHQAVGQAGWNAEEMRSAGLV